jgi:hypothetical protein
VARFSKKIWLVQEVLPVTAIMAIVCAEGGVPTYHFVFAMFSWKKSPKEQQSASKNAKQSSIDNMDFSDLLKDPIDSYGGEDGVDDMDPDLLVCAPRLSMNVGFCKNCFIDHSILTEFSLFRFRGNYRN